jgi:hypothetical protein
LPVGIERVIFGDHVTPETGVPTLVTVEEVKYPSSALASVCGFGEKPAEVAVDVFVRNLVTGRVTAGPHPA